MLPHSLYSGDILEYELNIRLCIEDKNLVIIYAYSSNRWFWFCWKCISSHDYRGSQ